jgi:hypothetical protein
MENLCTTSVIRDVSLRTSLHVDLNDRNYPKKGRADGDLPVLHANNQRRRARGSFEYHARDKRRHSQR